jgi:hypothetical protein
MSDTCQKDCERLLSRLNYFPRQLLTADCMREEQEYFLARMRRQNRFLHGFGVVCGLEVKPKETGEGPAGGAPAPLGTEICVCPGYAVTPEGDEVALTEPVCLDIASGKQDPSPCCDPWPCPPAGVGSSTHDRRDTTTVWLAVRYAECLTRPVRVPPKGCGCDETACDYSRIRDSYEIRCLPALPKSHSVAAEKDARWRDTWLEWREQSHENQRLPIPVPPCPDCPADPWVVLATIVLRKPAGQPLTIVDIRFDDRRVLLSVRSIMALVGT